VVAALCSAVCYGIASVVQQHAARKAPAGELLRLLLVLGLARQPVWLAGIALTGVSYLLQGLALAFGPLVLVQPLAAMDLVFALPLLARLRRHRPTAGEWAGGVCTVGGVAAFLTVLPAEVGYSIPVLADWLPVFLVVGGSVALLAPAGLRSRGRTRTALYALCAALLFALLDSLSKSAAERFRLDGFAALAHWEPYSLIFVGLAGLVFSQSSF
jgi:drug/metabolite transporter (DMT)-like permease